MINNSEDTIIRYNSLSKKDQELKNKIFNNNNEKKKQVIIDKNNKKEKKNNFEQGFDAPSQKQIDDFLKNMEDNFNKITESKYNNFNFFE